MKVLFLCLKHNTSASRRIAGKEVRNFQNDTRALWLARKKPQKRRKSRSLIVYLQMFP